MSDYKFYGLLLVYHYFSFFLSLAVVLHYNILVKIYFDPTSINLYFGIGLNLKMTKNVMKDIATYCDKHSLRFTEPRRLVAEIVFNSSKPIGAYEILDQLGKKIENPKPPTVYRALEFLSSHRFIHRIESLDAYVSCYTDHKHDGSQFMVCRTCKTVTEIHLCTIPQDLQKKADIAKFDISHWDMEIHGNCQRCSA